MSGVPHAQTGLQGLQGLQAPTQDCIHWHLMPDDPMTTASPLGLPEVPGPHVILS